MANQNQSLNRSTNYTDMDIGQMSEVIAKSVFHHAYKHGTEDPGELQMNDRIRKAYEQRYDQPFHPLRAGAQPPKPILHGPSGIGKTKIIEHAFKEVAKALDMNLHINPKGIQNFGPNDMIVSVINLKSAGDMPAMVAGIPTVNDVINTHGVTTPLTTVAPVDRIYAASKHSGGGITAAFFDEINSEVAHQAVMAAFDNNLGGDIDMSDTFMIGAGNLGEEDGNIASLMPVSVSTRAHNFKVHANYDYWLKTFLEPNFLSDPIGDFGVSAYLTAYRGDNKFSETPPKASEIEGTSSVYGNPRTWTNLINEISMFYGSDEALTKVSIDEMANFAAGIVGASGRSYAEFAYNMWTGVVPLAKNFLSDEGPSPSDIQEFKDKQGTARGAAEKEFLYQWAYQVPLIGIGKLNEMLRDKSLSETYNPTDPQQTKVVKDIFHEVGSRIGNAISMVTLNSMKNTSTAEMVGTLDRMVTNNFSHLKESGSIRSDLKQSLALGLSVALHKSGMDKNAISKLTAIIYNDNTRRSSFDKREAQQSAPSTAPSPTSTPL